MFILYLINKYFFKEKRNEAFRVDCQDCRGDKEYDFNQG